MADITPEDVEVIGKDAVSLMLNLMQRNERDAAYLANGIAESLQQDYERALEELNLVRNNVLHVLYKPHTDFDIREALFATTDLKDEKGFM